MNATKALAQLGFVTTRGLDNGDAGALMLSNRTAEQIHGLEEKRRLFLKLDESKADNKKSLKKSTNKLDQEKQDARWNSSKVREELCLTHEAYQFFRNKYKKRYGSHTPSPNKFLK